jgi:ferrochelatase
MPESVVEEIRHRYSLIGSSPLTELTLEQGRLLSQALDLPVYVGMRNWKPYIADVVRQMREDGITSAVVSVLRRRTPAPAWDSIAAPPLPRPRAPSKWTSSMAGPTIPSSPRPSPNACSRCGKVSLRASGPWRRCSLPRTASPAEPSRCSLRFPQGSRRPDLGPDPYPVEAKRTAANVAALLAPLGLTADDWFFAFQSQGMSGATWIGPTVEDTLTALRQEGHSAVVIQPIGFLCDHVEILYDIDIGFRDFAAGIGLEVVRPQSLNDSPLLTAALEDLARQGFARLAAKASLAHPSRSRSMSSAGSARALPLRGVASVAWRRLINWPAMEWSLHPF